MNLTQHFTLEELTHSDYADAHGIKNYPGQQAQQNLMMLCVLILEPLRMAIGEPIRINSAYRCKAVNTAVGGVSTSHHLLGLAADINFDSETQLTAMIRALRNNKHLDLALIERSKSSRWLHVQLPLTNHTPRHKISTIYVTK
jgi:zinc D-Ala-D-Ala carboxypeptidase